MRFGKNAVGVKELVKIQIQFVLNNVAHLGVIVHYQILSEDLMESVFRKVYVRKDCIGIIRS